ncbi:universal stress protein [Pseudomonas aeruginosa]|uniref:Universal stress protein n=1 Tax=Pseudomonas aeruginosa TaxID=287 RepID=A0A844NVE2_PSEAI|nr:universal stress protein [Pseudomonas aeruginosa]MUH94513.1 universal stress protein [Pseudomonas aeruginosa]MUI39571.1 universal stress protein [Pseudomonas aeruginosa]
MTYVMACIDGSPSAPAVCDYAAWASQRLDCPLAFLHVLDESRYPTNSNLSGNIGLGSREHLLEELAELDAQRSKLALEEGRLMLEAAKLRAQERGVSSPLLKQRHGDLAETLTELEDEIRIAVIGKQGDQAGVGAQVGSQLENVLRTLSRPVLVTPGVFKQPESVMLAYDGRPTMDKAVQLIAGSPLFRDLPIHLVMVGADTNDAWEQLRMAQENLKAAGFDAQIAIRAGEVEPTLHAYQNEHAIDMVVMGAYSRSRIREFLVGSTTTKMLSTSRTPLLLLH